MYTLKDNIVLPLKILEYNPESGLIEFVDQVTNYKSLRFVSDWEGVGTFTVEMSGDKGKAGNFVVGRIVQVANEIDRQGLIMKITRRMTVGDDGVLRNNILVSGIQLKGLMYFTLTVPPGGVFDPEAAWQWYDADGDLVDLNILDYFGTGIAYDVYENQQTESIMKDLVFNNRKVNDLTFQNIAHLDIETDLGRGINHEYETFRFKKLSESLEYLSKASGLGWDIVAQDGRLVFRVLEGVDRSAEQSENNPVIFSFDRGNVRRIEYTESTLEMNNQLLVGGQGEGSSRDLLVIGQFEETGVWSQLGFIDARDVETLEGLETRALNKIAEKKRQQSIEVTGFSKKILVKLGTDYNLGDRVTIKVDDWGLTLHVRVTGLTERQTINNAGTIEFEFGTQELKMENLIKQNFDNMNNEILR